MTVCTVSPGFAMLCLSLTRSPSPWLTVSPWTCPDACVHCGSFFPSLPPPGFLGLLLLALSCVSGGFSLSAYTVTKPIDDDDVYRLTLLYSLETKARRGAGEGREGKDGGNAI